MLIFPLIFIAAFVGFADSVYLTVEHYRGAAALCLVVEGCDKVLTSAFAVVAGVPMALLGVIFYSAVLAAACLFYRKRSVSFLAAGFLLAVSGFLFSIYSVYLQLAVIEAVCFYCMISAAAATTLFVLWSLVLAKRVFSA